MPGAADAQRYGFEGLWPDDKMNRNTYNIAEKVFYRIFEKTPINIGKTVIYFLYFLSLILPAFTAQQNAAPYYVDNNVWYGWQVLLFGWAGIFDGTVAWFANPVLILSLILLDLKNLNLKSIYLFFLSLFGFLLAISSLLYKKMWNDGGYSKITEYGPAFYLWIFSFILMMLLIIYKIYSEKYIIVPNHRST